MKTHISESEYLKAKKIVDDYQEQLRKDRILQDNILKEERERKHKWCEENGGHEYRPSGGSRSSAIEVTCINCNKTIN